jgi:large subunit ribosomal protein L6
MNSLIKLFKISKNINIQKKKDLYRFINLETKDSIEIKINNSFSLFIIKDYLYLKNISLTAGKLKTLLKQLKTLFIGLEQKFFYRVKINGVGFRFLDFKNNVLFLKAGYSNTIQINIPKTVLIKLINSTEILLMSFNYDILKLICSKIKKIRIPDVYKGKGICYFDEVISLKEIKK